VSTYTTYLNENKHLGFCNSDAGKYIGSKIVWGRGCRSTFRPRQQLHTLLLVCVCVCCTSYCSCWLHILTGRRRGEGRHTSSSFCYLTSFYQGLPIRKRISGREKEIERGRVSAACVGCVSTTAATGKAERTICGRRSGRVCLEVTRRLPPTRQKRTAPLLCPMLAMHHSRKEVCMGYVGGPCRKADLWRQGHLGIL
jgi:hypothetical protein